MYLGAPRQLFKGEATPRKPAWRRNDNCMLTAERGTKVTAASERSSSPPHVSRETVDEAILLATPNAGLDAIFRASPPGDVPIGLLDGTAILFPGTRASKVLAALTRMLWWQGKVVDRSGTWLFNRVSPFSVHLIKASVYSETSWVDGQDCIVLDYSKTSLLASGVRDEIRLVAPRLYLGVVWLWRRRVGWFTLRIPEGR
jgi:hypothetical protein